MTTKNTLRIVEVNYEFGSCKFFIEKKKSFLWFITYWKREKMLIESMFGLFETDREFETYNEAEDYVFYKYKNVELEEKQVMLQDSMW